jgi:ABC-type tungstate transport system permease subunit
MALEVNLNFSTSNAERSGFERRELELWKVIGMNCEFDLYTEVKIPYSPVKAFTHVSKERQ